MIFEWLGYKIMRKATKVGYKLMKKTTKDTTNTIVEFAVMYGESKINNVADEYLLRSYRSLFLSISLYFVTFMLILLSHTYEIIPIKFIYLVNIMYIIILSRGLYKIFRTVQKYRENKGNIRKYLDTFVWFVTYERADRSLTMTTNWLTIITGEQTGKKHKEKRLLVDTDLAVWRLFIRNTMWDLLCMIIRPFYTYRKRREAYSWGFKDFFINVVNHVYHDQTNHWHKSLYKILGNLEFVMTKDQLIDKLYGHTCKVLIEIFKKKASHYVGFFILFAVSLYIADQFMLRYVIVKTKLQMLTEPIILLFEHIFMN